MNISLSVNIINCSFNKKMEQTIPEIVIPARKQQALFKMNLSKKVAVEKP